MQTFAALSFESLDNLLPAHHPLGAALDEPILHSLAYSPRAADFWTQTMPLYATLLLTNQHVLLTDKHDHNKRLVSLS